MTDADGREFVLRRPPRTRRPALHDMGREHRIIRVGPTPVPVPGAHVLPTPT
jgi:aminoglycoside phosphotransferase (APT) family kinase protein